MDPHKRRRSSDLTNIDPIPENAPASPTHTPLPTFEKGSCACVGTTGEKGFVADIKMPEDLPVPHSEIGHHRHLIVHKDTHLDPKPIHP